MSSLHEPHRMCHKCSSWNLQSFFHTVSPLSGNPDIDQRWGLWEDRCFEDIQNNAGCPLCRLVCKALGQDTRSPYPNSKDRIYYYRMLHADYESQHHDFGSLLTLPSGQDDMLLWNLHQINRLRVSTDCQALNNVGIELARLRDCFDESISSSPFEVSEGDIMLLGHPRDNKANPDGLLLHGRRMGRKLDFALASSWINMCSAHHGQGCSVDSVSKRPSGPKRLIDVEARMVVYASLPCAYAALSYSWGEKCNQLCLVKDTYSRLTTPGGLADDFNDIPLTIKDAMILCSRLAIQYLWVDALCIQQDDSDDTSVQIDMMSAIYSGAHVTIVGASGSDSWAGLPGVREDSRSPQETEDLDGLTLAVVRPEFPSAVRGAYWCTRAWTFQEAVLSKRLLIFTDYQVFFQCNKALWWEDTNDELSHQDLPPEVHKNLRNVHIPTLTNPFWKEALPSSSSSFESYATLVQDYTKRNLTDQSDALRAFTGLTGALEKPLATQFFHGLPLRFFDAALCFQTPFCSQRSPERLHFPSWSWTAWKTDYPIEYYEGGGYVVHNLFYRINTTSGSRKQLIPIQAEGTAGTSFLFDPPRLPPSISAVSLKNLSNVEVGNLLVFEAMRTELNIDAKRDAYERYPIRIPCHPQDDALANKPIGSIYLCRQWRRSRGGLFEFIVIAHQREDSSEDNGSELSLMLVNNDSRGFSHRVQICNVEINALLRAQLTICYLYLPYINVSQSSNHHRFRSFQIPVGCDRELFMTHAPHTARPLRPLSTLVNGQMSEAEEGCALLEDINEHTYSISQNAHTVDCPAVDQHIVLNSFRFGGTKAVIDVAVLNQTRFDVLQKHLLQILSICLTSVKSDQPLKTVDLAGSADDLRLLVIHYVIRVTESPMQKPQFQSLSCGAGPSDMLLSKDSCSFGAVQITNHDTADKEYLRKG